MQDEEEENYHWTMPGHRITNHNVNHDDSDNDDEDYIEGRDSFHSVEALDLARFVPNELLQMVHQHHRREMHHHGANGRVGEDRPEVLQTWTYNWQTKERKIPKPMVEAGRCIATIEEAVGHLKGFHQKMMAVPDKLKPHQLDELHESTKEVLRSYSHVMLDLEAKMNAMRLYWFPETAEQLRLGAYQSVRHPPERWIATSFTDTTSTHTNEPEGHDGPMCVACFDPLSHVSSSEMPLAQAVVIKRRCTLNPLLHRVCTMAPCRCHHPSMCLNCVLDHVLRNGIHEAKSSVYCPACRGEFCIYDIQEVTM